jgi:uncharacterized membrane protein
LFAILIKIFPTKTKNNDNNKWQNFQSRVTTTKKTNTSNHKELCNTYVGGGVASSTMAKNATRAIWI